MYVFVLIIGVISIISGAVIMFRGYKNNPFTAFFGLIVIMLGFSLSITAIIHIMAPTDQNSVSTHISIEEIQPGTILELEYGDIILVTRTNEVQADIAAVRRLGMEFKKNLSKRAVRAYQPSDSLYQQVFINMLLSKIIEPDSTELKRREMQSRVPANAHL